MIDALRLCTVLLALTAASNARAAESPIVETVHLRDTAPLKSPKPDTENVGPVDSLDRSVAVLGDHQNRAAIEGLVSRADCNGPNGHFTTEVVSLANGPVRLVQKGSSGINSLLSDSNLTYHLQHGSAEMRPAPGHMSEFVRGHDVHRLLLDLDQRFEIVDVDPQEGCQKLESRDGRPASLCSDTKSGLPLHLEVSNPDEMGGGKVRLEFADWHTVAGVKLPFDVGFVHQGERFTYRYHTVLPFRVAPGSPLPADPTALFDRLGDLGEITMLHGRTMAAHRAGDIDALMADGAEVGTVSTRGQLVQRSRDETRSRLGPYLASTRFKRYEDTKVPVVAVSSDGSLGWLACEMEAEGTQTGTDGEEQFEFAFSWFEMLARHQGRWVRIGNASNQRP